MIASVRLTGVQPQPAGHSTPQGKRAPSQSSAVPRHDDGGKESAATPLPTEGIFIRIGELIGRSIEVATRMMNLANNGVRTVTVMCIAIACMCVAYQCNDFVLRSMQLVNQTNTDTITPLRELISAPAQNLATAMNERSNAEAARSSTASGEKA